MTERPHIADKVRFWEEQDRINKELIPRVLKVHELVTDHIAGHQDASIQIGALEARLVKQIDKARVLKVQELVTDHIAGHQDASLQIGAVEARLVDRINRTRALPMVVAGVSLVMAAISITLNVAL